MLLESIYKYIIFYQDCMDHILLVRLIINYNAGIYDIHLKYLIFLFNTVATLNKKRYNPTNTRNNK